MDDQPQPLQGRRILIVEDDYLVAQALSCLLEEAGASVLGPIGWAGEALSFVRENANAMDGAVVDVDLHGEKSYAVVDELATRHVRLVLATGYGLDAVDDRYREYPRCQKPCSAGALMAALTLR